MNFIQSSKERWLLYGGGILIFLGILMVWLIGTDNYNGSRTYQDISLQMFIVAAVIVAPLLEELAFRGNYTGGKILQWTAIIGMPIFLIITGTEWIGWLVLLIFYLLHFLSKRVADNGVVQKLSLFTNALLFGLVHYKISDFLVLETAYYVVFQIAMGLILIWVTINFGILKSMLVHSVYNAIPVLLLVIYVQFPDQTTRHFENDVMKVEWRRVPAVGSPTSHYETTDKVIEAKNIRGSIFYSLSEADSASTRKFNVLEPFVRFDFRFYLKDTTNGAKLQDQVKHFLENEMIRVSEEEM